MINLYFIRHFPTQSNNKNLWCGAKSNLSIDLSKADECVLKLNNLKNIKFDYVFLSPLKRCKQTLDKLKIHKTPMIDKRLIERDFGLIEQTPCTTKTKNILADWDKNTDLSKHVEKIQDMYFKKLLPFIEELKQLPSGSNVLVIAHSWIGRLLKYYFTNNKKEIEVAPKNGQLLYFELEN